MYAIAAALHHAHDVFVQEAPPRARLGEDHGARAGRTGARIQPALSTGRARTSVTSPPRPMRPGLLTGL